MLGRSWKFVILVAALALTACNGGDQTSGGDEAIPLPVGESQPQPQPFGILAHEHRERGEPKHRVGAAPELRL